MALPPPVDVDALIRDQARSHAVVREVHDA
jgi:hypothetical protein